jgi:hypothetical protein
MSTTQRVHHDVTYVYVPDAQAWKVYLGRVFLGLVAEVDGAFRTTRTDGAFTTRDAAGSALAANYLGHAY